MTIAAPDTTEVPALTDAPPTVGSFLLPAGFAGGEEGDFLDPVLASLAIAAAAIGGSVAWSEVRSEIAAQIAEVLAIDISDVVVAAWEKAEEFREYADPEAHPPDETIVTQLAEHTIDVDFHPSLELVLNDQALPGIALDVFLSLALKGLILKVRGGRVREMSVGSIVARGRLETAGLTILEKESEEIHLPRTRGSDTPPDAPPLDVPTAED